jgi:hypothetical protein
LHAARLRHFFGGLKLSLRSFLESPLDHAIRGDDGWAPAQDRRLVIRDRVDLEEGLSL